MSLIPRSTLGGAGISAIGAMNTNEAMAVGGFVLAVLGFFVNLFFKIQENRRQTELHRAQVAAIRGD